MSGVNKAMLLGRLGSDPDLKYTPGGAAVAKFSMATTENWVDKSGQRKEETTWHKVVVWDKMAENCARYLSKGRQVFVEGRIRVESWDDKTTGKKTYATEIVATNVQFISDGAPKDQAPSPDASRQFAQVPASPNLDDIPF
jgi:single-strand DNA-binding protein